MPPVMVVPTEDPIPCLKVVPVTQCLHGAHVTRRRCQPGRIDAVDTTLTTATVGAIIAAGWDAAGCTGHDQQIAAGVGPWHDRSGDPSRHIAATVIDQCVVWRGAVVDRCTPVAGRDHAVRAGLKQTASEPEVILLWNIDLLPYRRSRAMVAL